MIIKFAEFSSKIRFSFGKVFQLQGSKLGSTKKGPQCARVAICTAAVGLYGYGKAPPCCSERVNQTCFRQEFE